MKYVYTVDNEQDLLVIANRAKKERVPRYMVVDAGLTQIAAHSRTVIGVGPAPEEKIKKITRGLKLML